MDWLSGQPYTAAAVDTYTAAVRRHNEPATAGYVPDVWCSLVTDRWMMRPGAGWEPGEPVVIYHHGATEAVDAVFTDTQKAPLFRRLVAAGWAIAAHSAAGDNWGNQAAIDDYTALNARLGRGPRVLVCQSMGGLSALQMAAQDPLVVGVLGIYPCTNLQWAHDSGGILIPHVNAAYGGNFAAGSVGHDPTLFDVDVWAGLRFRWFHSEADTVVLKAPNTDTIAPLTLEGGALESDIVVTEGDHGHGSNFSAARQNDMMAFLGRCFG